MLSAIMRLLVSLLLLLPSLASAKCASEEFLFFGTVKDPVGSPVAYLPIAIEWRQGYGTIERLSTNSGPAGRFSFNVQFNTHSGSSFFGDRCNSRLEKATFHLGSPDARQSQTVGVSDNPASVELIYSKAVGLAPEHSLHADGL